MLGTVFINVEGSKCREVLENFTNF